MCILVLTRRRKPKSRRKHARESASSVKTERRTEPRHATALDELLAEGAGDDDDVDMGAASGASKEESKQEEGGRRARRAAKMRLFADSMASGDGTAIAPSKARKMAAERAKVNQQQAISASTRAANGGVLPDGELQLVGDLEGGWADVAESEATQGVSQQSVRKCLFGAVPASWHKSSTLWCILLFVHSSQRSSL